MHFIRRKFLRTSLAVSPGALAVALAFFTQVFESDNSLPVTEMFATGISPSNIAEALSHSSWEIRPSVVFNSPALSPKTTWIKMAIPASSNRREFVAETRSPLLSDLDFYLIKDDKVVDEWHSGFMHPESFRQNKGLYFSYNLPSSGENQLLLIRSISPGTGVPKFRLYDQSVFEAMGQLRDKVTGTLFGLSIMIIFVNLALLSSQKSLTYLMDAGVQTFFLVVVYFLEGYYKRITPNIEWDPHLLARVIISSYLIALFFVAEFYRRHLQIDRNFHDLT
ncbi:MAG: hypothetical protein RL011_520, partial [Pseudomonadota bacterium]